MLQQHSYKGLVDCSIAVSYTYIPSLIFSKNIQTHLHTYTPHWPQNASHTAGVTACNVLLRINECNSHAHTHMIRGGLMSSSAAGKIFKYSLGNSCRLILKIPKKRRQTHLYGEEITNISILELKKFKKKNEEKSSSRKVQQLINVYQGPPNSMTSKWFLMKEGRKALSSLAMRFYWEKRYLSKLSRV